MAPKLTIIVLNWNGSDDTVECVESLKKPGNPDCDILIVDNGSTDDSVRILRKRFPGITLIETGTNLGFAGGANAGIRHALSNGADHVILLNNDTIVAPDFATELVRAAGADPMAGIVCGKVYFYDRPDVIWYAGASFCAALGWGRHKGFGQKDTGQFSRMEETERPCGCAMLITKELCEKAGLFDEAYFCYCEDTDLGLRAKKAGFKVLFAPASKVWHKVSASSGGPGTAISLYYNVRNTLRCVDGNRPFPFLLRHLRYAAVIGAAFLSLFTMDVPKSAGARRILQGARDYFAGRTGAFR